MITPSFNLTATERVLPKLALDFTTASLDPRVTFTRTTGASNPATYVDSSGYIAAATDNQPRFDYNPVTLACKGLLIEESRTNLLLQSQTFQTTWAPTACTVSADSINGPDNLLTADKLIPDNGASVSNSAASVVLRQDITKAASAITYTYTLFAKIGDFNGIRLYVRDNASSANFAVATFSLVDGSVAVAASVGGTFTNASAPAGTAYANGFYRFSLTFTTGTETTIRVLAIPANSTATTGDGSKGIYIWSAQLETGAFATSYIPTTTTSLTRNADVATMTGTNFSDWFNATQGSFYVSGKLLNQKPGFRGIIAASDGTSTNYIAITQASNGYSVRGSILDTNVSQASLVLGNTSDNTKFKATLGYKLNLFAGSLNAANPVIDTSGTVPTVSQLNIGYFGTSQQNVCYIENISYWPQRLTDAEIQSFSK